MESSYSVNLHNRLARKILRPVFKGLFHLLADVDIIGVENIPEQGAYILAINHISIFDPPFVVAFWPTAPEVIGAVEVWSKRGQATLARLYGGIKVHRGQYSRRLIVSMINLLRSGYPLMIAPEGGRSHTPGLRPAFTGIAYVVERTKVPVLPVGVVGTTEDFFDKAIRAKRPKLEMRVGQLLQYPSVSSSKRERRAARKDYTDMIMANIAALLPEDYRGVYAEKATEITKAA